MNKVFAVGMKHHVEVRVSPKPLEKHESSDTFEVSVPYEKWVGDTYWGGYRTYFRKVKKTLTCVIYSGGKVLVCMKREKFKRLTKVSVGNGQMVELSQGVADSFLSGRLSKIGRI